MSSQMRSNLESFATSGANERSILSMDARLVLSRRADAGETSIALRTLVIFDFVMDRFHV